MSEQEELLKKLAERVKALEDAALPFVDAYERHVDREMTMSQRKACMCMDVSVRDLKKLAKTARGEA